MAATPTLVSVGEYLHTSYDPDRDCVDGERIERNVREHPHSEMQARVLFRFMQQAEGTPIDLVRSDLMLSDFFQALD